MAFLRSQHMPLVFFATGTALILCAYAGAGTVPSPMAEIILSKGWLLFMLIWMVSDARRTRGQPCYDFGFLSGVGFPLSLMWYCLWSRGWKRGLLVLLALAGLLMAPSIAAELYRTLVAG